MKKLTALAALLLAVSAGTTAFAQTEYDPTNESVTTSDQSSYKTVLITKGDGAEPTADNIVYMAQANTGFGAGTDFLLKQNPTDGVYTIRLGGGSNGQTATAKFAIGVGVTGYDTPLEALTEGEVASEDNTTYSLSFVTPNTGVRLTNGAVILVKIDNTVMAYPIDNNINISGDVTAILGVQIDDVPAEDKDNVKVYLRQGGSVTRSTQASESAGE